MHSSHNFSAGVQIAAEGVTHEVIDSPSNYLLPLLLLKCCLALSSPFELPSALSSFPFLLASSSPRGHYGMTLQN